MCAVMVLLELHSCSSDELRARDGRHTDPRCRCSINHHSSSSHQVSFVIVGAKTLLPSGAAHVAKLCAAQVSTESVKIQQDHQSDSRDVVAPDTQLHHPFTLLTRLISFCRSKGYQEGVGWILGAVVHMCHGFTYSAGQRSARTHGFFTTNVFGRNKSSTGISMTVSSIRGVELNSLHGEVLYLGRGEKWSGGLEWDRLATAARRE